MKIKPLFLTLFFIAAGSLYAQEYGPGTDIVGYGYNIFGKFADNSSKKPYALLEFGNDRTMRIGSSEYLVPEGIILENIAEKKKTEVSGSSQREYAKSFGVSVGLEVDALTFGASVDSSFDHSWGGSVEEHYHTIRDANRIWRVGINQRRDIQSFLDTQAKEDLATMDADRLLELYGTHVIVKAYLGGRADYTMITKMTEKYSATEIAAAVSATYSAVTADVGTTYSESENEIISNSRKTLTVTGGNAEFANDINDYEAYSNWAAGIRAMPVLCDFEKGSLLPIWELVEMDNAEQTRIRKAEIKAAFDRLAARYPLPEAYAGLRVGMEDSAYYIQSKSSGLYWDFLGYHYDAETFGTRLGLAPQEFNSQGVQGADRFVKLIQHNNQPEYVFFQPQHVIGGVVDTVNGSKDPGAPLGIWHHGENNTAQMFKMIEVDDEANTYYIQNASSLLYMTENNGQITQEEKTEANNQKWVFNKAHASQMAPPPAKRTYRIKNASSGLLWDVRNAGGSDSPIQMQHLNGHHAQVFYFFPFNDNQVMIKTMHNGATALDVHDSENAVLRSWNQNSSGSQMFRFEWAGYPLTYRIKRGGGSYYITADANGLSAGGSDFSILHARSFTDTPQGQKLQTWTVEPAPPMATSASNRIWHEGSWEPGSRVLQTENGLHSMVFQKDGNLVVYNWGTRAVWASGTENRGAERLAYQRDGNLVIYGANNSVIWASGSHGKNGEALYMHEDGNVMIHAPGAQVIWTTNTGGK